MINYLLKPSRLKVLLSVAVALLVLSLGTGAALTVQTFRLQAERADHKATLADLNRERIMTAIYKNSAESASRGISALQEQLSVMDAARSRDRMQTAKREIVLRDVKQIPAVSAGVVDQETSRKAVDHINETLARRSRF